MTASHNHSELKSFLTSTADIAAPRNGETDDSPLWQDYVTLLGPLWEAYPDLLDRSEWSIPYATLIGDVLNRVVRLADRYTLVDDVTPRNVLLPLLAPPGDVRELHQTQYRLPLTHTLQALDAADALSVLKIAGYLPPNDPKTRTLWFAICGIADWQRPQVSGAEARATATWREPALLLEQEHELPYFVELTFPGNRRATLADEHRASILSGRLRPSGDSQWIADWLRSGQYVIERRGFEAFLRGIVTDWQAWRRSSRRTSVLAHLRRLRDLLPDLR